MPDTSTTHPGIISPHHRIALLEDFVPFQNTQNLCAVEDLFHIARFRIHLPGNDTRVLRAGVALVCERTMCVARALTVGNFSTGESRRAMERLPLIMPDTTFLS